MKNKKRLLPVIMMILLSISALRSLAQTSQTATQSACIGNQIYAVDPIVGATFVWTITGGVPADFHINGTGNSISVDWNTAGSYVLSVYSYKAISCPSPTQSVTVTAVAQPIGPTLNAKSPNIASVCDGISVSSTFTPGSGGVGCSDSFEYRFDGGAWTAYISGTSLSTVGHTSVEIQGQRSGCTANAGCSGTSWVTLASWTVTPNLPVSVTNVVDQNNVCGATAVNYTATPTNGGLLPVYAWYVNGVVQLSTSAGFGYTAVDGDVVYAILTSNVGCTSGNPATSNTVTMIVNPIPTTSAIWHN